jgi:hypothetical protein
MQEVGLVIGSRDILFWDILPFLIELIEFDNYTGPAIETTEATN